jgi:hypothetical protein
LVQTSLRERAAAPPDQLTCQCAFLRRCNKLLMRLFTSTELGRLLSFLIEQTFEAVYHLRILLGHADDVVQLRAFSIRQVKGRGHAVTRTIDLFPSARSSSSVTSCAGPTTRQDFPACSSIADGFNGFVVHLAKRRCAADGGVAALAKLQADKRRMGWISWGLSSRDRPQRRLQGPGHRTAAGEGGAE